MGQKKYKSKGGGVMSDIKKAIIVYENGTTNEYEKFIGTFLNNEGVKYAVSGINQAEATLFTQRMSMIDKLNMEKALRESIDDLKGVE